jgi:hypothetical protein
MMAENIFDAMHYCSVFSKLINFNFVTFIKSKCVKHHQRTSFYDILRLLVGISLTLWLWSELSNRKLALSSRSIIFEIGKFLGSKLEIVHPSIVTVQLFIYRHEYFNMLNNINWIDQRVINVMHKQCLELMNCCHFSSYQLESHVITTAIVLS